MTKQTDIKKLAEQMASSMNSFEDIKDFQKQLMQSFIDTALEAERKTILAILSMRKRISLINATGILKRQFALTQAILR